MNLKKCFIQSTLYFIESWCELQYKSGCSSSGSISHLHHSVNPEVLEKLLQEAQKDSLSPSPNRHLFQPLQSNELNELIISDNLNQLDTSTPMLVKFSNQSILKPIPTSPISMKYNNDDDLISKTVTFPSTVTMLANLSKQNTEQCSSCIRHKQQIDTLLEKQLDQEKQLFELKKEYDEKFLSKSPDFMLHCSSRSSISSSSIIEEQCIMHKNQFLVNNLNR